MKRMKQTHFAAYALIGLGFLLGLLGLGLCWVTSSLWLSVAVLTMATTITLAALYLRFWLDPGGF